MGSGGQLGLYSEYFPEEEKGRWEYEGEKLEERKWRKYSTASASKEGLTGILLLNCVQLHRVLTNFRWAYKVEEIQKYK